MQMMRNIALLGISAGLYEAAAADVAGGQTPPATKPKREPPVVEKVTMEDGRVVEFVGKRRMLKEGIFNEDGTLNHVRFDFKNGRVLQFIPNREVKTTDGHLLGERFLAHGIEQKLGDETAGFDPNEDIDDMVLDVAALIERLGKDPAEWSMRREGGGMAGTSILIKALIELSGGKRTAESVTAWMKEKNMTQADKMALRQSPQLKPIVERLEQEKAAKGSKIDVGALLAGFEEPTAGATV